MLFQIISNKSILNMIHAQIEYTALLAWILTVVISIVTIMMALEEYLSCWKIWQTIDAHSNTIPTLLRELLSLISKVTYPSSPVAAVYETQFEFTDRINDLSFYIRKDAMYPGEGIIINQDCQHLR